jgi:putative protein-disulfide isomerase
MSKVTLHYLYDPFCGWCYGAAPLVSAAAEIDGVEIKPHGIGMLSGDQSKMMSGEWRDFVRPHEERITAYSQQEFADAYVTGVLDHEDVLLDSSPPTAAMLTAEKLDGRGIEMLKRLQIAYYQEGRAIADPKVIEQVAAELGFEPQQFMKVFDDVSKTPLNAHLAQSKALMSLLQARGVPSLALEIDGRFEPLHLGHYLGQPALFKETIESRLAA